MKTFSKASSYNGKIWDIIQYDINSLDELKHLDENLIEKVHAVCLFEDRSVIVYHPQTKSWGIPGGTREKGASLEETLIREIQEETNCEVLKIVPTSYQLFIDQDGIIGSYRVQFFCKVKPLGEFESDTAGNITKIEWVNPYDLLDYIEKKDYRQAIVQRVIDNLEYYKNI